MQNYGSTWHSRTSGNFFWRVHKPHLCWASKSLIAFIMECCVQQGVIGGLFPAFRGKFHVFPAFRSFFPSFRLSATFHRLLGVSQFSAVFQDSFLVSTVFKISFPFSADILKFSSFTWLENVIFRFSAEFFFTFFRHLFDAFPAFRHKYNAPSVHIVGGSTSSLDPLNMYASAINNR